MAGQEFDVIVVGGGNAGLAAAISAQEAGAKVLIVEKAPEESRGGNTRLTELYRFAYDGLKDLRALVPHLTDEQAASIDVGQYTADQFYNDLMRVSGERADPAFSEVLVNESYSTIKWLVGLGVKWDVAWDIGHPGADGKIRFQTGMPTRAAGGGLDVIRVLFDLAQQRGATVLYQAKAAKLLVDETGRVCGVRVKDKAGFRDIKAKAVVLACGGFQASPEMRTKYLGPGWDMVKVRGTRYNTGDGLKMALKIGAATTGQFSGCHATQVILEGPEFEMGDLAWAHGYTQGILVNADGKRFIDEGEDFDLYTYAKLGRAVLAQPRNIGFQIFDQKGERAVYGSLLAKYRAAHPVVADTIEEAAHKLDIDEQSLVTTVRQFNAAVQDGPFDPSIRDGKRTEGIEPRKSNWALPIDEPPYVAYPVTCGITFTFGGLKTDTNAQVIDTEGNTIAGLYAAGEVVGSFYFNYAGASGLIKGAVFGKIAGKRAASERES